MNSKEWDQLKDKILNQRDQARKDEYLNRIHEHANMVAGNPSNIDNIKYLTKILRDVGLCKMADLDLEGKILKDLLKLFEENEISTEAKISLENDFEQAERGFEKYLETKAKFKEPPRFIKEADAEQEWEDDWRGILSMGLDFLLKLFDNTAIVSGFKQIFAGRRRDLDRNKFYNLCKHHGFEKFSFLLGENIESFYCFSDELRPYLYRFPNMEKDLLYPHYHKITRPREDYAAERFYRYIIDPDTIDEIYYRISDKFQEENSTARVYFFKAALAEEALTAFIFTAILAKNTGDSRHWILQGTGDEDFSSTIPMLRAGDREYSIHMLGPGVSGWGMRTDRLKPFLSPQNPNYAGGLFCSWKQYPHDQILVRFDNYLKRDRLQGIVNQSDENFFRLNPEEIYQEDFRQEFIRSSSDAALELDSTAPVSSDEPWKKEIVKELATLESGATVDLWMQLQGAIERGSVKPGEEAKGIPQWPVSTETIFYINFPADGHLIAYHCDPDGKESLIFPYPKKPATLVSHTQENPILIPGYIEGPFGTHKIRVIWTPKPLLDSKYIDLSSKSSIERTKKRFMDEISKLSEVEMLESIYRYEVVDGE